MLGHVPLSAVMCVSELTADLQKETRIGLWQGGKENSAITVVSGAPVSMPYHKLTHVPFELILNRNIFIYVTGGQLISYLTSYSLR